VDQRASRGSWPAYQTVDCAQAGRIVGHSIMCAGSHREPSARGVRESRRRASIATEPPCGRADGGGSQERSEEPDSGDRGHGAGQTRPWPVVRRRAALRLQGLSLTLPLTWLEQRLFESDLTIEQLVHAENQQQSADQVSIQQQHRQPAHPRRNGLAQIRGEHERVEQILREDPAGIYPGMDSATRDHYRRTVETIARRSPLAESEVARQAIRLAQAGTGPSGRAHPARRLLFDRPGLPQLERAAQVKGSIAGALRGPSGRFPLLIYLGGSCC